MQNSRKVWVLTLELICVQDIKYFEELMHTVGLIPNPEKRFSKDFQRVLEKEIMKFDMVERIHVLEIQVQCSQILWKEILFNKAQNYQEFISKNSVNFSEF